jgi:hypothetical protein
MLRHGRALADNDIGTRTLQVYLGHCCVGAGPVKKPKLDFLVDSPTRRRPLTCSKQLLRAAIGNERPDE